jgi:tetratricopeptide (TPR) repeat protein
MRRHLSIIFGLLFMVVPPVLAGAVGTQSPFSLGVGARDLAQGGSAFNIPDPATAVYWNPSALARVDRLGVGVSHSRLFETGIAYQYLGAAVPTVDVGCFGLGVFRLGVDGIDRRDEFNVSHGEARESRMAMYLGYGRFLAGYAVGAAVALEHHALDGHSATSSPGMSLAVSRRFALPYPRIAGITPGLSLRNVVRPHMKLVSEEIEFPTETDGAVSVDLVPNPAWDQTVTVSAGVSKVAGLDAVFKAGIEYSIQDLLHLRGGLRDRRASFGAGISYRSISIDYVMVERDLGSLHMFSVSTALGTPTSAKRRIREERQEAEFTRLVGERLSARNLAMVSALVAKGEELTHEGAFDAARVALDRALFLGEGSGLDTTAVYAGAQTAVRKLDEAWRKTRFEADMDSAWSRLSAGDLLGARYYAVQAVSGFPESIAARDVLDRIDQRIEQTMAGQSAIDHGILRADSLTSYGEFKEALAVAVALRDMAADDERIEATVRKAEFGLWKQRAEDAFSRSDYRTAQAAVDSALMRFPKHPWGIALSARIKEETKRAAATVASPTPQSVAGPLSARTESEAEEAYKDGQKLFEEGRLTEAVDRWETVEALAPGYRSVRAYLVNAYKFLGVELYSQNHLEEAVDVWKKAADLDPNSGEIAGYIRRTQAEISRLQEISYDLR